MLTKEECLKKIKVCIEKFNLIKFTEEVKNADYQLSGSVHLFNNQQGLASQQFMLLYQLADGELAISVEPAVKNDTLGKPYFESYVIHVRISLYASTDTQNQSFECTKAEFQDLVTTFNKVFDQKKKLLTEKNKVALDHILDSWSNYTINNQTV